MNTSLAIKRPSFAATFRTDAWWVEPLVVLLGLSAFVVYSTWAAFQAEFYWWGSYLSPMYSPLIFIKEGVAGGAPMEHAWLGAWPSWWPAFLPASPSLLILIFPLTFRFTCYYYRGAYYKAFAGSPPACGVGAVPQKDYQGETFLLIFQNLHRYALYFALIFVVILSYDAFLAFFYHGKFGFGIGTMVLVINPILLGMYTLGCHSFRHLVGGRKDCFSCAGAGRLQNGVYHKVSWLNGHHKLFAWLSLLWVGFTDFYVRMVSMEVIIDVNTWGI